MRTPFSETLFRAFYRNIEDISNERKRPWAGRVFQTRRQIEPENDEEKGGKKEEGKRHLDEPEEEKEGG